MNAKAPLGVWQKVRAGLLLEFELRNTPADNPVPPAVRSLQEMPVLTRLTYARSWLEKTDIDDPDSITLCEAVVHHVCRIRDQELSELDRRRDFISETRNTLQEIQRIALQFIDQAIRCGDQQRAESYERKLLVWIDQFENRILLEEIRDSLQQADQQAEPDGDAQQGNVVSAGKGVFEESWGNQELASLQPEALESWFEERRRRLQSDFPADVVLHASTNLANCVLDSPKDSAAKSAPGGHISNHAPRTPLKVDQTLEDSALLIPENAIYVRAVFESDGTLRWWAWSNDSGNAKRIAGGKSKPQARERLEAANFQFDLAVESTWNACSSAKINGQVLLSFSEQFDHVLTDQTRRREVMEQRERMFEFFAWAKECLGRLRVSSPVLAAVGGELLQSLRQRRDVETVAQDRRYQQWQLGLESLRDPWPEPRFSWSRERRRQRELNEATQQHISAMQAEFSLEALSCVPDIDFINRDIVFQVQGPLLAMPLGWLEFRKSPLFENVASISTSISMSLRRHTELRCQDAPLGSRRLLSVFWEDSNQGHRPSHGMPLLHAGLRQLVGPENCWTLGDEPKATAENLSRALNQERFGVVVIGAHGSLHDCGVKLADNAYWCGDGADFSDVDLLVLVSCAVGRLAQATGSDVEGLYARLAVHGSRCMIAARWPIADTEAAYFCLLVLREYLDELNRKQKVEPFDRARAVNRARRNLLNDAEHPLTISTHLMAAFEVYGLA